MFYSDYGSWMHELIEKYYTEDASNEELKMQFITQFPSKVVGERPIQQGLVSKYIKAGVSYFDNIKPFPYNPIEIEKWTEFSVNGIPFCGRIDFLGEKDGEYYIVDNKSRDLKPRSKRKKPTQDDMLLDKMLRQLYLYSIPVKQEYGKYPKALCFNCFKSGTFIEEPFSEDKLEEAINWLTSQVEAIKREENFNPNLDYFKCKYICGLHKECCYCGGDKH